MITLKITALILGAGTLVAMFAEEIGPDVVLAVFGALSQIRDHPHPDVQQFAAIPIPKGLIICAAPLATK